MDTAMTDYVVWKHQAETCNPNKGAVCGDSVQDVTMRKKRSASGEEKLTRKKSENPKDREYCEDIFTNPQATKNDYRTGNEYR